jgi:hypothetical protein
VTAKTMAEVIAANIEHEGDRYDFANSVSIKVIGLDLQEALSAAGFGLVADVKADSDLILTALQHCGVRPEDQFDALVAVQKLRAAAVRGEG